MRKGQMNGVLRAAVVAAAVVALPACELLLQESAPERGASCPSWRSGCGSSVNFAADGPAPGIRADDQRTGNVAFSDQGASPDCDTAPWICQAPGAIGVLETQYFDKID